MTIFTIVDILIWYIVFVVNTKYETLPRLFYLYIIPLILFPNGIGFKYRVDFHLWQITSLLFLLPGLIFLIQRKLLKLDLINILIILLVILGVPAIFFFEGTFAGLGKFYKGFCYILLPFFAGRYFINGKQQFFKFFNVITILVIIISLLAIFEFLYGREYLNQLAPLFIDPTSWDASLGRYTRFGVNRVQVSFVHPVFLGVFIMLISLINLTVLLNKMINPKYIKRKYCIAQILLSPVVLLVTGARTAAIGFILAAISAVILHWNKYSLKRLIMYSVLLLTGGFLILNLFFGQYIEGLFYHNVVSAEAFDTMISKRLSMIEGIKYISRNINWLGENNREATGEWTLKNYELSNGFLNCLSIYGIFYFITYGFIWIVAIRSSLRINKKNSGIGLILFISFVYMFLVNNISELNFQNLVFFFIFVGLANNRSLLSGAIKSHPKKSISVWDRDL